MLHNTGSTTFTPRWLWVWSRTDRVAELHGNPPPSLPPPRGMARGVTTHSFWSSNTSVGCSGAKHDASRMGGS